MRKIKLSQGMFALVDNEDYAKVSAHKWCASLEGRGSKYYAIRWKRINGKATKIRMHHFVLGIAPMSLFQSDMVVDHLDDDSLNNSKGNLELVTEIVNLTRARRKKVVEPCL